MTIRKKLLLLLAFPLLVIVCFSGASVYNLYKTQKDAKQITALVELSATSGKLIHEIQKERGMSVGFLGSKGASFKEELQKQRQLVDQKFEELQTTLEQVPSDYLAESLLAVIESVYADFDEVPSIREQVNALSMPAGAAAGFYTGINKKLIEGVVAFSSLSKDTPITQEITGYALFLSGKDYAGIERAMLSAAFGADQFSPPIFDKYVNAKASQREDFNKFVLYASEGAAAQFDELTQNDVYKEVNRLRSVADSKSYTGGFGVDPTYWFSAMTDYINQLKVIEDYQSQSIIAKAEVLTKQATTTIYAWVIGLCCIFLLVIFSGKNIIFSIIIPMEQLLDEAAKIAMGYTDLEAKQEINDELGGVSFMFHSMMENISETMDKLEEEKALADEAVRKSEHLQQETRESEKELKTSVHTMLSALESFADGDLSIELPPHSNPQIARLYEGYNTALAKVRSLILQLKHVADQTYQLTAVTNKLGSKIADDARLLSNNSSDVATTTADMAESMTGNAKLASSTSEMSIESGQAAEKGIQIVEQTVDRIKSIADTVNRCVSVIDKLGRSSEEITGIISVIEDIAEQTNLLALNAAIEAARAGESGRGFAVVAEEVRNLSERTKDSTRQIESVVKALNLDTRNAVDVMREGKDLVNEGLQLADNAHQALQGIGENVQTMVQVVTRIAASIEDEASRTNEAALLMKSIDQEAQKTSEDVGQVVNSLKKLDLLSGEVSELVKIFNVGQRAEALEPVA